MILPSAKTAQFIVGLTLLSVLFSCSSGDQKAGEAVLKDSIATSASAPDSSKAPPALTAGLEFFSNIEQVDFCVPLPMNEYPLDETEKREHAHYVFKNKTNKKYEIDVQGMFRSDGSMSIEKYFENSYPPEDAEGGKNIEEKAIVKKTNCFYARGFWSNFAIDSRFIEVVWLRKDDIVKLYAEFPIADTTLWNERLKQMVESDSYCK